MLATQKSRAHLVSRIAQRKDDWEWLEEIWNKIPQTNHNHIFGLNRQLIMTEMLCGLTPAECTQLTQAMIKMVDDEEIRNLLINKLKI
jgi:hypothetical protein